MGEQVDVVNARVEQRVRSIAEVIDFRDHDGSLRACGDGFAEASLAGGLTGFRVRGLMSQEESGGRHDIRAASTFGERLGLSR